MAKRVIFKPHLVEAPNTYTFQDNGDGTHTLIPVTGTVFQQGTPITSENLNNVEQEMLLSVEDISANTTQIVVTIDGIQTTETIPNTLLVKIQGDVTGDVNLIVQDGNLSTVASFTVKVVKSNGEDILQNETLYNGSYAIFSLDYTNLKAYLVSSSVGAAPSGTVDNAILSDGSVQMNVGYVPILDQDVATKTYADAISELREIPVDENEPTGDQVLWFKII